MITTLCMERFDIDTFDVLHFDLWQKRDVVSWLHLLIPCAPQRQPLQHASRPIEWQIGRAAFMGC